MSPRTGRPTNNPKKADRVTVRLDEDCSQTLEKYCKQESIDKGTAIRRGIKKLKAELKK